MSSDNTSNPSRKNEKGKKVLIKKDEKTTSKHTIKQTNNAIIQKEQNKNKVTQSKLAQTNTS